MIYLDTNVLLYATLSKVDTQSQQDKAIGILKELLKDESLLLSNLNLLEYVFVMNKANEEKEKIENSLSLFKEFVKDEKDGFHNKLILLLRSSDIFKNSFDFYHIMFADSYKCQKLLTFDKEFKKFINKFNVNIKIL